MVKFTLRVYYIILSDRQKKMASIYTEIWFMLIQWEHHQSITILSFESEDIRDSEPLRAMITKFLEEGRRDFLIDLENVVYLSSSVLGLLITLFKDLKLKGGRLELVNAQPSISNLFEITRLDKILEIYNDKVTALISFE